LAAEFIRKGEPTGWFEALYKEAEAGKSIVPWADGRTNPHLVEFWEAHPLETAGKSALVVGSGMGDDAELLSAWGFETMAFDISETAIRATRKRFPKSQVEYVVADVLRPPAEWQNKFDFVLEVYTLQVLPAELRLRAMEKIASFVKAGGNLLVLARGREPGEPEGEMPWPVTRAELEKLKQAGMKEVSFENYFDEEEPPARRFRVLYRKLQARSVPPQVVHIAG
jgi:SAM-dependent methyltransferase